MTRASGAAPRTAAAFGYLWSRSRAAAPSHDPPPPQPYHMDRLMERLPLTLHGLVLDAGCGEGIDLANQASRDGVEIVGVELSKEGCRISQERTARLRSASVVQGDLCQLPLKDGCFDVVYSYGVLHPRRGKGCASSCESSSPARGSPRTSMKTSATGRSSGVGS